MENIILSDLFARYPSLYAVRESIEMAYALWIDRFARGGKLLLCGNGGSAADCDHIVGELMKGFLLPRPLSDADVGRLTDDSVAKNLQNGLPAISLCAHSALTTAVANDTDDSMIFAQQVWVYGDGEKDLLLALSTGGNSINILHAAQTARAKKLPVVSITGNSGGRLRALSDVCICLPASQTYQVQELTLPVYHALCAAAEAHFFK